MTTTLLFNAWFFLFVIIYTYIYIYVYFFIYKDPWEDPMHMGNIYGKYDGFVPFFPACGIHVQLWMLWQGKDKLFFRGRVRIMENLYAILCRGNDGKSMGLWSIICMFNFMMALPNCWCGLPYGTLYGRYQDLRNYRTICRGKWGTHRPPFIRCWLFCLVNVEAKKHTYIIYVYIIQFMYVYIYIILCIYYVCIYI